MFGTGISAILAIILFVGAMTISCDAKSNMEITKTPKEILSLSGLSMQDISSFEFELSHKNVSGTQIGDLVFSKAEGLISSDNTMLVEGKFLFGSLTLSGKLITIDDEIFFLNPLTQKWERTEGTVTVLSFFKPEEGIKKILDSVTSPSIESSGKTYWNIRGSMPASALSNIIGETTENEVEISIWIDKTTNYLTRAIIYGKLNEYDRSEPDNTIQRIITISKINEALFIEHPLK